jgi:hypothetical protein
MSFEGLVRVSGAGALGRWFGIARAGSPTPSPGVKGAKIVNKEYRAMHPASGQIVHCDGFIG